MVPDRAPNLCTRLFGRSRLVTFAFSGLQNLQSEQQTSRFILLLGLSFGSIVSLLRRRDCRVATGAASSLVRLFLRAGCTGFAFPCLLDASFVSTGNARFVIAPFTSSCSNSALFLALLASRSSSLTDQKFINTPNTPSKASFITY